MEIVLNKGSSLAVVDSIIADFWCCGGPQTDEDIIGAN